MAGYVDLYVLPLPKRNLAAYRRVAKGWGRIMRSHGIVAYREWIATGEKPWAGLLPAEKLAKAKKGEVMVFSVAEFRSKAHRDRVNARGMADPRMGRLMKGKPLFDMKRMSIGEFREIVRG